MGASMPWLPALGGVGAQLLRCLCVARGAAREPRVVGRHWKGTSMPVISMTLGRRRALFTRLLAELIGEAIRQGFEPRIAETLRRPELAEEFVRRKMSHASSLHFLGLAVDLLLFRDGRWLTRSEHYESLGKWWEQRHPDCRWGGRFADGNHFSITPEDGRA